MIRSSLVRLLDIDPAVHPRGQPHISSASGLVIVGNWFYFVADDENHLIALPADDVASSAIRMTPLVAAPLPTDAAERKRRKKDLEALFHLPGDERRPPMLVAWGSASRPSRDFAYAIALGDDGGLAGAVRTIVLSRLHDRLRAQVPELNIEAALVRDTELWLFSRAHRSARLNGWFRLDLAQTVGYLLGDDAAADLPAMRFEHVDLGTVRDVPIGITDVAPLDGGGWLFSAVAEDSSDAYEDGPCMGAMLVAFGADGQRVWSGSLDEGPKVEGIAFDPHRMLWLTTDADAPDVPSQLRRLQWPPPGFCGVA